MIARAISSLALGLGLASVALSAPAWAQQDTTPYPTVEVDTVERPAPDPNSPYVIDYRRLCVGDVARAPLPEDFIPGFDLYATLHTGQGDIAEIAICAAGSQEALAYKVDDHNLALVILAYRPMAPLWEQGEALWGSDLSDLRAQLRERALAGQFHVGHPALANRTRKAIGTSSMLSALGYFDDALAVLDEETAYLTEGFRARLRSRDFDRVMLSLNHAGVLASQQSSLAAAEDMAGPVAQLPPDHRHHLNLVINFAAYLAEAGENTVSNAKIVPAYDEFRGLDYSPETYSIGGSDREFSWIIACNFHRLGEHGKAEEFVAVVESAEERPSDEYAAAGVNTKRSSLIKLRMYACMGDAQRWYSVFTDDRLPALTRDWLRLQDGWRGRYASPDVSAMPHDLAAFFAKRFRQLPERYYPALRSWNPLYLDAERGAP